MGNKVKENTNKLDPDCNKDRCFFCCSRKGALEGEVDENTNLDSGYRYQEL